MFWAKLVTQIMQYNPSLINPVFSQQNQIHLSTFCSQTQALYTAVSFCVMIPSLTIEKNAN